MSVIHKIRRRIQQKLGGDLGGSPRTPAVRPGHRLIPDFQPFPLHCLPPVLGAMVMGVSRSVGCDPAYAALPGLVVSAATGGAAVVATSKRGWLEPCALFGCLVGKSGSAKSPAADPFMKVADLLEDDLEQEYQDRVASYEATLAAHKEDPDRHPKPDTPQREYFLVTDCTYERLVENLLTSSRGLLVHRDEMAGFFGGLTRYRSSGSDLPNWLSVWDAKAISYQRKTGVPRDVRVRRAVVSLYGGIQPDVLRTVFSDTGFLHSGFAARILFAMPPSRAVRWSEAELDPQDEAAFTAALRFLRTIPFDPKRPARIGLCADASGMIAAFTNEMADRTDEQDDPIRASFSKLNRAAMRLALVHHSLVSAAAEVDPGTRSIGAESLTAGIELARWFGREAERVFFMLAEQPEDGEVRHLAELVQRKGGKVTPRDLMRANDRKYPTTEAAEAALDLLVSAGLGEWVEETAANNKGVRRLALLPDARRCPTSAEMTPSQSSDTPGEAIPEYPEISGESAAESGSVGRRETATPAEPGCTGRGAVSGSRPPGSEGPQPHSPDPTPEDIARDPIEFQKFLERVGWTWPDLRARLVADSGEPLPADLTFEDLLLVQRQHVVTQLSSMLRVPPPDE